MHQKTGNEPRRGRFLRGRLGGRAESWDGDEVAAHLMTCHAEIVKGLGRQSPWAGMDEPSRDSCFHHAAAYISLVAAAGSRPDWRSFDDLERAQVTAFRHQALDHWKRLNAVSRRGDRLAVEFDPERHIAGHEPIDRLFEQPDFVTFERDLLAELTEPNLREFWAVVIGEQVTFKQAGDRLGLSKAGVMAATRAGRSVFSGYLARRDSGDLCRERGLDIEADRAGKASVIQRERAQAHLEGCYACALVYEPTTSAFSRGILGLAPTGLILRLVARVGDASSVPALRFAESGSGSRAVAAGLAAVSVAGAGVGVSAQTADREPAPRRTPSAKRSPAVLPSSAALRAPAPPSFPRTVSGTVQVARAKPKTATKPRPKRPRARAVAPAPAAPAAGTSAAPARVAVPLGEFGVEASPAPSAPTAPSPPSAATSPAAEEFPTP